MSPNFLFRGDTMYKINDKVYLYLKGAKKETFALNGLHRSRFGTIKDIYKENNKTVYEVKLDITDKNIIVSEDQGSFTFYNMNELLDIIRSTNISIESKEKYTELINDIIQDKKIENKQYRF